MTEKRFPARSGISSLVIAGLVLAGAYVVILAFIFLTPVVTQMTALKPDPPATTGTAPAP
jgi:hypothetical protein